MSSITFNYQAQSVEENSRSISFVRKCTRNCSFLPAPCTSILTQSSLNSFIIIIPLVQQKNNTITSSSPLCLICQTLYCSKTSVKSRKKNIITGWSQKRLIFQPLYWSGSVEHHRKTTRNLKTEITTGICRCSTCKCPKTRGYKNNHEIKRKFI